MRLFSVIVTTLNFADYVTRTLDSVLASIDVLSRQPGAPGVEVLVVDDGSSDGTPGIVSRFIAGRDWRLLRRPRPTSPSAARNFGAANTSGNVLFFLDGDDLFMPTHLAVCQRALTENFDFVKTGVRLAEPVHPDWVPRIEGSLVINLAVRRRCHDAVGGFPDLHIFRRGRSGQQEYTHELEVFRGCEDQFYNQALSRRYSGVGVRELTVEYIRRPGNAYDRQLGKFRRPASEARGPTNPRDRLQLQIAELLIDGVPSAPLAAVPLRVVETSNPLADTTAAVPLQVVKASNPLADTTGSSGGAEAVLSQARHLAGAGKLDDAIEAYRRVLAGQPGLAEAAHGLGLVLAEAGKAKEGIVYLRRAAALVPHNGVWQHNLGVALAQCGMPLEAIEALGAALIARPDYPEACYNLGALLADLGRQDEAISSYRRAVSLRPDYFEALNNLGLALSGAGKHEEAVPVLRQAARLRPDQSEAHNNLGLALLGLGRFVEAELSFEKSLGLNPSYADAHNNLGGVYKEQGRLNEALAQYSLALAIAPRSESLRYNRSLALLQNGEWDEGWREYEFRWRRKKTPERRLPRPRWDGSPLGGRTLLLYCEQGLGDAIQFVRYAEICSRLGGAVVLECPPPLVRLFSTVRGVQAVIAEGEALPAFDCYAPLMSLPGLLRTTPQTVPACVPYLRADFACAERWKTRLAGLRGLKVGIVWQGNPRFEWDRWRSFPLNLLAPLAAVPQVNLVSLQKGYGSEQLAELRGRFEVMDLGEDLDAGGAFLDTAGVLECLDLVVSADTSVAHLAGALGIPVWLALSAVSDWRWMRGQDTPWYPRHRLFRQESPGDWSPVFKRVAEELRKQTAQVRPAVCIEVNAGELIDKLTILRIKAARITDESKRLHVTAELAALERARTDAQIDARARFGSVKELERQLQGVNERLWDVEDVLRAKEACGDFGVEFVKSARTVYRLNDERSDLKRRISEACGSPWVEQKQYGSQ